jgi:hypothetical protein
MKKVRGKETDPKIIKQIKSNQIKEKKTKMQSSVPLSFEGTTHPKMAETRQDSSKNNENDEYAEKEKEQESMTLEAINEYRKLCGRPTMTIEQLREEMANYQDDGWYERHQQSIMDGNL